MVGECCVHDATEVYEILLFGDHVLKAGSRALMDRPNSPGPKKTLFGLKII